MCSVFTEWISTVSIYKIDQALSRCKYLNMVIGKIAEYYLGVFRKTTNPRIFDIENE